MYVMKDLAMLQALASAQAYRINLRARMQQIGISERGKVRTPKELTQVPEKDVCTLAAARKNNSNVTTRFV